MFLYELTDAFEKVRLRYAIVGGFAMALHGLVRATIDVDFVLSLRLEEFEKAEKCLAGLGLKSRIPVRARDIIKMRKEYIKNRNLIAWSFVDWSNPLRQVDILITKDLEDLATEKISVAGRHLVVVSLLQLQKLKEESDRPQDQVDVMNIKKLLKNSPKVKSRGKK